MEKQDFEAKIGGLLPEYDREAMKVWHQYAEELDADELVSKDKFYDATYVEFSLVAGQYGDKLATELFSIANISCINPFEIRGASHYLQDGVPLADVAQLAIDGECDSTVKEDRQSHAALDALRKESAVEKPSIIAQLKESRPESAPDTPHKPPRDQSGPEL